MRVLDRDAHRRSLSANRQVRGELWDGGEKEVFRPDAKPFVRSLTITSEGYWAGSGNRRRFLENTLYPRMRAAREAKRSNTANSAAAINSFTAMAMADIQGLAQDKTDYSGTLINKIDQRFITPTVKLRDILPPIGRAGDFAGTGDEPPLLYHQEPAAADIQLKFRGFTDKSEIYAIEFGQDYHLLAEGAANVIADERNAALFKPMVEAAYDAAHSVTWQAPAGASWEEQFYRTVAAAKAKLRTLKNPLSGAPLNLSQGEITVYLPEGSDIMARIISGVLLGAPGNTTQTAPISVDNVVMYSGGINHGKVTPNGTLKFPGIGEDYGYAALKLREGAHLLTHIDWNTSTFESPRKINGVVQDFWGCFGSYFDPVLPSVVNGVNYGAIIQFPLHA
ncbi:MAG: hypothetical protein LBD37_03450 [Treponema sp.]|jgi:hypothetical protein|nr:hypothetical protein [Treponema sp.]